jgi:hypothetical protein
MVKVNPIPNTVYRYGTGTPYQRSILGLGRYRNSGPVVIHSYSNSGDQNLGWSRNFGPVALHSNRKSGPVQKIWTSCIFIHTENLGTFRNSRPVLINSYRKSGVVQKFWNSCISFIQKIWERPEILDQLHFHSYRKSGVVQKFWTSCISFIQKIWAGPEILDKLHFIHTENLGWSRNSGPLLPHSYRYLDASSHDWREKKSDECDDCEKIRTSHLIALKVKLLCSFERNSSSLN